MKDLPQLLQGRSLHGCTYYDNNEGTKVNIEYDYYGIVSHGQTFLVTGGWNGTDYLSSTELLKENSTTWVLTGELPNPRYGLRLATVDNRVLLTGKDQLLMSCNSQISSTLKQKSMDSNLMNCSGGEDNEIRDSDNYNDDILEYLPVNEEWKRLNSMREGRYSHAVSVVKLTSISRFCNL